jgi:hypothetical protein
METTAHVRSCKAPNELDSRKRELAKLLRNARLGLQLNGHIEEPGNIVFRSCRLGLEMHRLEAARVYLPQRALAPHPRGRSREREAEEDWGAGATAIKSPAKRAGRVEGVNLWRLTRRSVTQD